MLQTKEHFINNASSADKVSNDPRIAKAMCVIKSVFVVYPTVGLLITLLDLGKYDISLQFCEFMKSIVPSIHGTALVAADVAGTDLVLSLAWLTGLCTACLWLYWALPAKIVTTKLKGNLGKNLLKLMSLQIIVIAFTIWLFNNEMTLEGFGRSSRLITWSLLNGAFTSSLIVGMMIIVPFFLSALLFFLIIKTIYFSLEN